MEVQTKQSPGRVHVLPWQQVDSTTAVGLQALEESITQEKHRAQEALEKAQTRIRDLESHLASQKEVRPAPGGQPARGTEGDRRGVGHSSTILCCLSWPGLCSWEKQRGLGREPWRCKLANQLRREKKVNVMSQAWWLLPVPLTLGD